MEARLAAQVGRTMRHVPLREKVLMREFCCVRLAAVAAYQLHSNRYFLPLGVSTEPRYLQGGGARAAASSAKRSHRWVSNDAGTLTPRARTRLHNCSVISMRSSSPSTTQRKAIACWLRRLPAGTVQSAGSLQYFRSPRGP